MLLTGNTALATIGQGAHGVLLREQEEEGRRAPRGDARTPTIDRLLFNNETVAEVRHHYQGAFAFGASDLVTFNIHGDGKVWWREGVAAESSQTPRPVFKSPLVRFPAPRHQVYDVINDSIEANEIPPEKWYPKGHKPVLVREWPLTEDIEILIRLRTRRSRLQAAE